MVELFRTCRAILKNLFFTFEPRWNAISREEFVSSILFFLKIFSVLFWFLFSVNVFVYSSAGFSFVCPSFSTCPFSVTSRSVSQSVIHTCRSHFGSVSVFSLFVCIIVVSQSIRHTVHKFIRQIVKPSVCSSIFLFVFAILLVCLLAIHLVCKILVTLYW